MAYHHLRLEEREKLFGWKLQGISLREIAKRIDRSHASLSRELRRNAKYGNPYLPIHAQRKADRLSTLQRYKAPLKEPLVFLYVREHLRKPYHWSPESIAGRLSIDYPGYSITDEAIYQYIYGKKQRWMKLWKHLPLKRKKRCKKQGRRVACEKIPEAISIDVRSPDVKDRTIPGHWETDNMEGVRSDTVVVSATVERMTRMTLLSRLSNRKADAKTQAVVHRLRMFPTPIRLSLTADNGAENSDHKRITKCLSLPVYFCHPYHSWEKGTVENTIGRVRRYIPKGVSIDALTDEQVSAIEESMNSTPRKCLGFLTPYEKMVQLLQTP